MTHRNPDGPAAALVSSYLDGRSSPVAEARRCLQRIDELNPRLNMFITVLRESATQAASESEKRYRSGSPRGPLDGVPVAVKDLFYIQGVRCTAGSRILANNVATYDAPAVAKLKAAGAVIVGTTNMHEFAAGTTSVNPHFGAVRNPWNPARISGGSSGGSAAAVASGVVPVALGTDTAGSVRIPAALCGVVGLKPNYGRVSRLGVVPLSTSLDTVGVIARSSTDAANALAVISGHEEGDVTTLESAAFAFDPTPASSSRVGLVKNRFQDTTDPAVEKNLLKFVAELSELGFQTEEVELDGLAEVYERWLPIRRAEATAFHSKWLESNPGLYGDDVRKLLELGRDVLAVDYVNAVNARPSYMERFSASMKGFDAVVIPTTSISAPEIGVSMVRANGADVPVYSALNRLTFPFNYVGFPVVSVPSGMVDGTPVGVQLVGNLFDEGKILRLAAAHEAKFGLFPTPPGLDGRPPTP